MAIVKVTPKIFVTRGDLPRTAMDLLSGFDVELYDGVGRIPKDIFHRKISNKEALFISSNDKIDKETLNAAPHLKVIATMSSGIDHIDVEEVKKRDIKLGCTKGVLESAVAELAIGLLISGIRKFVEGRNHIVSGTWPQLPRWDWMNGSMIKGSIVSIVGFGFIGSEIAQRLVPFKPAKMLYCSRKPKKEADKVGAFFSNIDEICRTSDIIIITLPLNSDTKGLFNEDKFEKMKQNAYILNVSRGGIIDQNALVKAVNNKRIAGAALDVMTPEPLPQDHEMVYMKNITLLPHLGSAESSTRVRMAEVTSENIVAGLTGKKLPIEV